MNDPAIDAAAAFLRGHSTADLRFDEHQRPIKYVTGPDGRLIAPVMVAMLNAVETVLFIPLFEDGAMEVMVTLTPFEERGLDGAAADRWRIYHGEPQDVRWAFMAIDSARFDSVVIDGTVLQRPNPLAQDEGRLCARMNKEHKVDLRRLCGRFGGMDVEDPVMVGIDPQGIDVRARFDVLRVPANEPMNTAADAQRILKSMAFQANATASGSSHE